MTTPVARIAAAVGLAILAMPATAHADAAGPTDYETQIVSVAPDPAPFTATIEGGDAFVRLAVEPGHDVIVLGYDDEPYLHFAADGTVSRNARSYATYYNAERYGGSEIPDIVDNTAAPEWDEVGTGGAWAWHDHRAHWMGDDPPIGLEPGGALPSDEVPLVVDGAPGEIVVITTLLASPSPWPAAFGLLAGVLIVMLGALLGPATVTLAGLLLSIGAIVVGVGQYTSLSSETGPLVTWWLLPAISLACTIGVIAIYGRSVLVESALVALAGAQLVLWAFLRRGSITKPMLPTDLAFWFDRAMTAAAITGGTLLVVLALRQMFRTRPRDAELV